jgi:Leucine-rich repeat (LRR) protein
MTNLERLDLTGNLLSSVEPLNALTEQTWLDIGGNQIWILRRLHRW